jgi:hypothetical protein
MKEKSRSKKNVKEIQVPREHVAKDLQELEHNELSGSESKESSLAASSTDENEDEGLGDGNIGRSQVDILGK